MYLDVSESPERQLFLTVVTNLIDFRLFSVRIVQLSEAKAPQGCLQYFTEPTGLIESFNYNMASASISLKYPQYLVIIENACVVMVGVLIGSPFWLSEQLKLRDLYKTEHGTLYTDLQ